MNQNRPFPSPEVMTGRLRCRGDDDPRAVETDKTLRRLHAIPTRLALREGEDEEVTDKTRS